MTTRTYAHEIIRRHRQQAERIDAHPELDRRARLHEGDDYYSRDKSSTVNAAAICALLMAGLIVVGSVVQIVGWVSG